MPNESPTLEERVGWLEDRMDTIEHDFEVAKNAIGHSHNTSAMLFGELVTYLVIEGKIEREDFIRFLHTRIELDAIERRADRQTIDALRARVDILRAESMHETVGPSYRKNEEALLARSQADRAAQIAKARATRAKRKTPGSPRPSDADASPHDGAEQPDATSQE